MNQKTQHEKRNPYSEGELFAIRILVIGGFIFILWCLLQGQI
jgi:hypothetical protein